MTRKDYIAIAQVLHAFYASERGQMNEAQFRLLIDRLSDVLQRDNPNFRRGTFRDACFEGD
jgi:hypothetical protein